MTRLKLFEEWSHSDNAPDRWMQDTLDEVGAISSLDEMREWVFKSTLGHMVPLNPVEPLRSCLREKIESLKENDALDSLLDRLRDEWKSIGPPPGAYC